MAKKTDVLLDMLPDPDPPNDDNENKIEVAHAAEDAKEEIQQETETQTKVKRSKTKVQDDEGSDKFWEIAKYAAVAGVAVLFIEFIINKRRKKKQPDMSEMMMMLMYQTMMIQMQNMQKKSENSLPPQIATDDNTKFSTDWSKWFEENKDKDFVKFGTGKHQTLNKMHVAENWRVRRDLNGKILDVNKVSEYIR